MIFKYLLILTFLPFQGAVQEYTEKRIDSIQENETTALQKAGKFEEVILLNIELIKVSKQLGYRKGVAWGYRHIARVLNTLGRYEESLRYLKLAEKEKYTKKDAELMALIFAEYGRSYMSLEGHKKALEYFDKGFLYLEDLEVKNKKNKRRLAALYHNKAVAFSGLNNLDSVLSYTHKGVRFLPSVIGYSILAYYHLENGNNNRDSAAYYLNKAEKLLPEKQTWMYDRSVFLLNSGRLCKARGDYKGALDSYRQAIVVSRKIKRVKEVKRAYKLISETYQLSNEQGKAHEYLLKYSKLSDSINREKKKDLNVLITKFLKNQEEEHISFKKRLQLIAGGVAVFGIVIFFAVVKYHRKSRKKGQQKLVERDTVIRQKEMEKKELQQKLNVAFEEVATLAKENDPGFLPRFQEVYPEVCAKLLAVNPKLVNTELTLCAMIWLNFSSKEIARYTFVQPKTVQMKKYRVRKKLGIPSDEDIYSWIRKL